MKPWKSLLELIKYRPWLYLLNAILACSNWLLFLVPPYVFKRFFDQLNSSNQQITLLWGLIGIFVMGHVVRIGIFLWNRYVDVTFTQLISSLLRKNMISEHYQKHASEVQSTLKGEIINRYRDDVEGTTTFLGIINLLDVLGAALFSVLALIMMIRADAALTIYVFLPLLIVVIIAHIARKKISTFQERVRERTGEVSGFIGEMFSVIQAVQVAGAESNVNKQFKQLNDRREEAAVKEAVFGSVITSTFSNVVNLGTGLILLLAVSKIRAGSFSIGDFAMFTYYLTWVTIMIVRFGGLTASYQKIAVSLERMNELCKSPETLVRHIPVLEVDIDQDYAKTSISVSNDSNESQFKELVVESLSYHYPNSQNGVENISLTLKRGTLTVITGKVGAGKSTLFKSIIGGLPIKSGGVYWNDTLISNPADFLIPPRLAYVPQTPIIFNESIKHNILLGIREEQVNINKYVKTAVLDRDITEIAEGYDYIAGVKGAKLSGGQRQRLSIIRALIRDSEIIMMDNVSTALDSDTEHLLWNQILNENPDKTFLVITHQPFLLKIAHKIIVMKQGELAGIGSLDELLKNSDEMKELWNELQ